MLVRILVVSTLVCAYIETQSENESQI